MDSSASIDDLAPWDSARPQRRRLIWIAVILSTAMALLAGLGYFLLFWGHQHCLVATGMALKAYADMHEGRYPVHPNGFGDALLLLTRENLAGISSLCGPGDNGAMLQSALGTSSDVAEDQCSRVYVQGLSESSDRRLCLIFDRRSTRGGDHRRGFGPRVREVFTIGGGMSAISDDQWPAFKSEQIQLLTTAGISREVAEKYYQAP